MILVCFDAAHGQSRCDINKEGSSGDKEKILLQLWECFRNLDRPTCGRTRTPNLEILLEKGEKRDIGYDVNGRNIVAKYHGKDVCVSYYMFYTVSYEGIEQKITESCATICFVGEDSVVYSQNITCKASSSGCDGRVGSLSLETRDSAVTTRQNVLFVLLVTLLSSLIIKLA